MKALEKVHFKQATYTGIYNMKVHHADPNECRIQGAEFLPTGEFVVCDRANQTLKLWSQTFQYLAHFALPGRLNIVNCRSKHKQPKIYVTRVLLGEHVFLLPK